MSKGADTVSGGPPLRLLAFAGGFGVLGFVLLMLWLTSTAFVNTAKDKFFLDTTVDRFGSEDALRVVIIGDSRLWFGLADDSEISKALSDALGQPVKVSSAFATNGEFRTFRDVIPRLLSKEPDAFIIQSALPFKQKNRSGLANANRDTLLQNTFLRSKASQSRISNMDGCGFLTMDADLQSDGGLADLDTTFRADGAAYTASEDLLRIIDASDTALLMVAAPEPRFGPLPLPDHPRLNLTELRPNVTIPSHAFCDPLHVTDEGAALYTAAFVQSVAGWLDAKDQGK